MRKTFADTASQIIAKDEQSVILLGDIGVYGFKEILLKYPKRAFNIGILEQSMVSVAAGFSILNRRRNIWNGESGCSIFPKTCSAESQLNKALAAKTGSVHNRCLVPKDWVKKNEFRSPFS